MIPLRTLSLRARVCRAAQAGVWPRRSVRRGLNGREEQAPPPRISGSCAATVHSSAGPAAGSKRPRPRVCILGGGFGGLYTAVRLEGLMWPEGTKPIVTLIDQNDRFLFKPLMYELLNGTATEEEVCPEYAQVLAPFQARFMQARVRSVEHDDASGGGRIQLAGHDNLEFDWLVLALGAETSTELAAGASEHAIGFATREDMLRTDAALQTLKAEAAAGRTPVVSIVGGGCAGVELATCVAELLGQQARVQLLSPSGEVMPEVPAGLASAGRRVLERAGVNVRAARVEQVSEGRTSACADVGKKVKLKIGGTVASEESDVVLWTAGQTPAVVKQKNGFPWPTTERGLAATDAQLRVLGHPRVFAIGDSAAAEQQAAASGTAGPFPATAQVALQQADYVSWNLWASITRRPLLPFKYQHLGTMLSFGKSAGAVALNLPIPAEVADLVKNTPLAAVADALGVDVQRGDNGMTVAGPLGGLMRRVAYLWRQPTGAQRARVGQNWAESTLSSAGKSAATGLSK